MFGRKHLISAVLYLFLTLFVSAKVNAVTEPSFPSCTNPEGTIKSNFSSGTHGIPGSSAEYKGKDTVYRLSNDTLTQCFCSENGDGIQTNWWKVSNITDSEVQTLKNLGWIYVPNGLLWGLEDGSYLVKNSGYNCGGGSVLGTATKNVLGLAATGDSVITFSFALIGVLVFLIGITLLRKEKSKLLK